MISRNPMKIQNASTNPCRTIAADQTRRPIPHTFFAPKRSSICPERPFTASVPIAKADMSSPKEASVIAKSFSIGSIAKEITTRSR